MRLIALLLALGLTACATTSQVAPGKSASAAAVVNAQLAIEYMKLDKLMTAREFADRALGQDPRSANVQMTAGLIYERMEETDKADRAFATAARLGKDDPNIQNNYAGYLCRRNRAEEGEKLFLKVLHNPVYQTPEVAYLNAGVCVRSTDEIAAEQYFRHALVLRPNMPEALLQLGELVFDQGDANQASLMVQRYLASNPPGPDIYALGVRAARKQGDDAAAANYLRRLQTEFPNSEQARSVRAGIK